jgi:hypothetical protein
MSIIGRQKGARKRLLVVVDTREKDRGTKAIHRSIADASTAKKMVLASIDRISLLSDTRDYSYGSWEERKEICLSL